MNYRTLGKSGIKVSEIAFGSVEIGLPYGIGVKSKDDMLSEQEAINLLNSAVDKGINFFDTARMYGNSEYIIGKAFKDKRDKVVISTKCKRFNEVGNKLPSNIELRETILTSLHESLAALKTDYVDVYMLHQVDLEILKNSIIAETLLELKSDGVIRAIGVSTYTTEETRIAIEKGIWDVIQLPFNLMDQSQKVNFSLASKHGVGIVVRSVLFKGILSNKGKKLHPALKDVEKHVEKYNELLSKSIPSLPMLATKFALTFDEVSSVLVGIDREEYLEESLEAANGIYLDENTFSKLEALRYSDPEFLDLVKWNKMGWLT